MKYSPGKIEKKWQKFWSLKKVYFSKNFSKKPKKYILVEFPYPSGAGLHTGHLRSYVAADVTSRFLRSKGNEVMFPLGWDAFGLPAENYAIKMGIQPQISTAQNIKNFKKQINSLGLSFDWSREVNTTDPEYYKWTQWLFLQFFKQDLAYEATSLINWCPKDKTGLANEEVVDGKCERCGTLVEKKEMRQWYLRITKYAQKLIDGLESLDWPEPVKLQQENWIGRSEGADIEFEIAGENKRVKVFTTRPDTIFGATYLVLAPEHPLLSQLKSNIRNWDQVSAYIHEAKNKTDLQRSALEKEKTGVELKGVSAINPATKELIPVWIADYVMISYGTGAIMAVPSHDVRDEQFAKRYKLPMRIVVNEKGKLISSGEFDNLDWQEAKKRITQKFGTSKIQYKLRDWVFSRQRYWGEPIPLIHCPDCGIVPVPEKDLPVKLPKVKKYEPTGTGESPLAAIESWVNVKCPKCGGKAKRETNTMPQWAGSSWYYLRYADPKNKKRFADLKSLKYWLPIDIYFGGMEHTTLHLLYSRFWNQFLFDQGLVPVSEPYKRRQPHGIILGEDGEKMSKSRGNVANPDAIIKQYGADTLRMFELFLGPHEQTISWNEKGVVGVYRFLQRSWSLVEENASSKNKDSEKAEFEIHKLIKRVEDAINDMKFNTAVSSFMEFINAVSEESISKETLKKFVVCLAPFAPHVSEEFWKMLGGKGSVTIQKWPVYDKVKLVSQTTEYVIQVNGKFRGNLTIARGSAEEKVKEEALKIDTVTNAIANAKIRKIVFVPDRLINFVV
ncbi:MAG: leucyl-tRNA ligase LeuS [Candidatus Doudnabacteria bacterium Gr01-1014_77]|uniref:Leucine--tRNA ligase n=1 Tax=Candidatus Doudnabacteria bacterium Gr01-1014_77 TaxID=2017133 RepID=A0A554JDY4_9BACT|nr:MAG: leucyl-tRNA ligase LeuS [Candidatus Doudnabacteria bacterium Gr01-1014_77]